MVNRGKPVMLDGYYLSGQAVRIGLGRRLNPFFCKALWQPGVWRSLSSRLARYLHP